MDSATGDGEDIDDLDGATRAAFGGALDADGFAINRYRLPPGTDLPSGLHTHLDQEEVFVVLDGELTFETLSGPVVVSEGEAIRFAPGEYQTGANQSDSSATVLAIGAPKRSEAVRVPLDCPDCGERGLSPEWEAGDVLLVCPDCDGEHRTRGCPDCGREEMRVAAGDEAGETVVVCPDCGTELPEPRWGE